jgi:hypothetical protein
MVLTKLPSAGEAKGENGEGANVTDVVNFICKPV